MIVLVNIVSKFRGVEDKSRPPSGILYVGGALRKAGYDVMVYHIFEREIDKAVKEIISLKPIYVGFSVFTGYPCFTSAVMSKKLKKEIPDITIVWGGIHPSIDPENCLKEDYIDFVVIGEGELTAVDFTKEFTGNRNFALVKSIGYKTVNGIKINERRELIKNLDEYKMDFSLIDLSDYVRLSSDNKKLFCFITSRGCPFNCGFCYNEKFHNRKYRSHSNEYVIDEVKKIQEKTGIERISFDDDHFFANFKKKVLLLEELKKINIICDWIECRLEIVTNENISKLRDIGINCIFFGWESGCNRILKLINKSITKETIKEKFKLLANFKEITYRGSGIIGFPTETLKEMNETIDFVIELSDIIKNANFNLGTYMPFPGTSLYKLAIKEGFSPPKNIEMWKDFDIINGNMDITWLPWASKRTKRNLYLIDKYTGYLDRSFLYTRKNILKKSAKLIIYFLSRLRLRFRFYYFPYEVYIQNHWLKYRLRQNIRKASNYKSVKK